MRHVSRTHRVALDWLFDRIIFEPKVQIKYVDTKNQLEDILTKGSFTKYKWNHFLSLFNIMSFSMCSCHKLSLSDWRAHCDWCHVETRTEHDFESKTYESDDAQSVQLHEVWDLWSIRRMTMKVKESDENQETGCTPTQDWKSDIPKWVDERRFFKPAGNWSRRIKPKQKVMRTLQALGNLPHLHQSSKTWNTRTIDTWVRSFSVWRRSWECLQPTQHSRMDPYKTHVLIWWMFFSFIDESAIHRGPDFLMNSEIYKNTHFEDIESVFNIAQKVGNGTFWRNSGCEMPGVFIHHIPGRDRY